MIQRTGLIAGGLCSLLAYEALNLQYVIILATWRQRKQPVNTELAHKSLFKYYVGVSTHLTTLATYMSAVWVGHTPKTTVFTYARVFLCSYLMLMF